VEFRLWVCITLKLLKIVASSIDLWGNSISSLLLGKLTVMITYQNASRRPAAFKSMFGFSVAAFDTLFREFDAAHQLRLSQAEVTRKNALPRQRKVGAGRKFKHDLRDRLLLALFWLRVYPTLELLGFFFSLDKTSAKTRSRLLSVSCFSEGVRFSSMLRSRASMTALLIISAVS